MSVRRIVRDSVSSHVPDCGKLRTPWSTAVALLSRVTASVMPEAGKECTAEALAMVVTASLKKCILVLVWEGDVIGKVKTGD